MPHRRGEYGYRQSRAARMPRSLHRYTLGQVAGPVRIVSPCNRGKISQKLAWHCLHDDIGKPGLAYLDEIIKHVIVVTADPNDVCASASELGRPRKDVGPRCVAGGQNQAGRARFDQGDDAVLQFPGGETLGMDIANFLYFQRRFQGGRIVWSATDDEKMLRRGDPTRDIADSLAASVS